MNHHHHPYHHHDHDHGEHNHTQGERVLLISSPTTVCQFMGSHVTLSPPGSLSHHCAQCSASRPDLLRCSGCRMLRYCSREHQILHRKQHKLDCTSIGKFRLQRDRLERTLRNTRIGLSPLSNIFDNCYGRFWTRQESQEFMIAHYYLTDALRTSGTLDGIRESVDRCFEMLRQSRGDNIGLRDSVPAMLLQLDRDQDCYNFVKWWETSAANPSYDQYNLRQPYLDLHNAYPLEDLDFLCGLRMPRLSMVSALLLLNMKLLVDGVNVKIARQVIGNKLPQELCSHIESFITRSALSQKWLVGRSPKNLWLVENRLYTQIPHLVHLTDKANVHFLDTILKESAELLGPPPCHYTWGSIEEALLICHFSYNAWKGHQGTLALLQSMRSLAQKDLPRARAAVADLPGVVGLPRKQKQAAIDRLTVRELMWAYVSRAVKDATSLSSIPPSQQPRSSEQEQALFTQRVNIAGIWNNMQGDGQASLAETSHREANAREKN